MYNIKNYSTKTIKNDKAHQITIFFNKIKNKS